MSEIRIAQMIDNQLGGIDPFAQARAMADQKSQTQPEQMLMLNSIFNPEKDQMAQFKAAKPQTTEQPISASVMGSLNSQPKISFERSDLPKLLQKSGIDDKGLSLNELGRIQLIGRLKGKFGDYQRSPEALDILSKFDETINQTPMDNQKSLNRVVSNGDRTLKALLGGS